MYKVSIIIPCFNQAEYLVECINSVLSQTYKNFECIIVNDGSEDNTEEVYSLLFKANSKIKYIYQENRGLSAARNCGINEASGDLILPLDCDDKIESTYLEKAISIFDKDERFSIVYCKANYFGSQVGEWRLDSYTLERMLESNIIFCSAFFWKKDWEKVGGYDESFKSGWEDWDFWLRIIQLRNNVYCIPEVLFYYRVKSESMVKSMSTDLEKYLREKVYKKYNDFYIMNFVNPIELAVQNRELLHNNSLLEKELSSLRKLQSIKYGLVYYLKKIMKFFFTYKR
jgi:glycosyltransferase involved in cell wall biosynthesis